MPYIGPLKLFILANILFFAVQSSTELRVFSSRLEQQIDAEDGTVLARSMVDHYLAEKSATIEEYAPIYNRAVSVNARSMIGLMILPFALFLPLVFWRAQRPFAVDIVFSLNFYSFLLLLYCLPAALIAIQGVVLGSASLSRASDNVLSVVLLLVRATYMYIAINRVYGSRGILRPLQAVALVTAEFTCFLLYRFILLPITLYTT